MTEGKIYNSLNGWTDGETIGNNDFIIIMAGMAVVLRGWLPHRGKAQIYGL